MTLGWLPVYFSITYINTQAVIHLVHTTLGDDCDIWLSRDLRSSGWRENQTSVQEGRLEPANRNSSLGLGFRVFVLSLVWIFVGEGCFLFLFRVCCFSLLCLPLSWWKNMLLSSLSQEKHPAKFDCLLEHYIVSISKNTPWDCWDGSIEHFLLLWRTWVQFHT